MSWPLACFAIVAAVLVIGWLAYERSRPSARTVALVATLSALAALGRDAFAAVDEVKPITAMTFVVGYALGPLPGFVVGAIGMLASNIVLGQGSWTPWQMAAWGIVGLLGALAGKVSRRRLRRVPLAIGCALAALIAKEIMNIYDWSIGAIHTPAALLAEVISSWPFDVVDIVSTFLFGLAFGPELARLLGRIKSRTEVDWREAGTVLPAALLAIAGGLALGGLALGAAPARAAVISRSMAISDGVRYLVSAQKADGGFGAQAGAASTELYTGWSAIGLAAAGRNPLSVAKNGQSVADGLRAGVGSISNARSFSTVGAIERTIVALHACGLPAGSLDGKDLVADLATYRKPDGSFAQEAILTAFGIFALRALGHPSSDPVVQAAGRWLARQQNADGGFSFGAKGDPSDVDDTAAAMQGLVASGVHAAGGLAKASSFLRRVENHDGGFPLQPGEESNAQSTAWAIQGLIAAGEPPSERGRSPITYIESLVASNGSVEYSKGVVQAPVWVTGEALAALARRPLPVEAPKAQAPDSPASALATGAGTLGADCLFALSGLLAS